MNLSQFKNDLEILTCSETFKIQDQFENINVNENVNVNALLDGKRVSRQNICFEV